ncbi:hypothetical protein BS50DRAFT_679241 [Corynespora cassiicola Philippines]|uniref:C2H2-type domain-containing protein n=1 Tax=Corynespora cassiicola Philippines TaxID=1448308 RepID=A0A2T2NF82_CORCC|nr:hypothetical protein BS50DRAFT_679241 [Corynespora cassiicola Philippines]
MMEGGYAPHSMFATETGAHLGYQMDVDQPGAFYSAQPAEHVNRQPHMADQSPEYNYRFSGQWMGSSTMRPSNNVSHRRHHSGSTQSSLSSSQYRSSSGSNFSQWRLRDSMTSTNSAGSNLSESARKHHLAQTESSFNLDSSMPCSPTHGHAEEPHQGPHGDVPPQDREPFATCVSRTKRSRRSNKQPRYWCTSCKEGFGEKYDWKRHEETYQERFDMYECDLCKKTYFLDKDFIHHHQKGHRCKTCAENQHVEIAKRPRKARTGWGCGFCVHFDADWTDRCNHIAWHFEKNGDTMDNWKHSVVILSLLKRPSIYSEWMDLLYRKKEANPRFGWNQHETGRAEGYPYTRTSAQLQDLLEFYTPDQDSKALVRLAYELGHLRSRSRTNSLPRPQTQAEDPHHHQHPQQQQHHYNQQQHQHAVISDSASQLSGTTAYSALETTPPPQQQQPTAMTPPHPPPPRRRSSSSPDKALPQLPQFFASRSQVPPKKLQHQHQRHHSQQSQQSSSSSNSSGSGSGGAGAHTSYLIPELKRDSESWDRFLSTIIEDYIPPTAVTEIGYGDVYEGRVAGVQGGRGYR